MTELQNQWRIADELRAKIAAVSPEIGRRQVAAMFGVSDKTVGNIRREFGVVTHGRGARGIWNDVPTFFRSATTWPLRKQSPRPLEWAA
jgi:hypothetical protein